MTQKRDGVRGNQVHGKTGVRSLQLPQCILYKAMYRHYRSQHVTYVMAIDTQVLLGRIPRHLDTSKDHLQIAFKRKRYTYRITVRQRAGKAHAAVVWFFQQRMSSVTAATDRCATEWQILLSDFTWSIWAADAGTLAF